MTNSSLKLEDLYNPIEEELAVVGQVITKSLQNSQHKYILDLCQYPLKSGGKRLRPALLILSARAALQSNDPSINLKLANIASAIELIHMASLIHDDIIDQATLRRNLPTVNHEQGQDVAIALGDYLYSAAFELIATCNNSDVLDSISSATKAMCEGELLQVCYRDNLDLSREDYMTIVQKKTAALFASSCEAGSLLVGSDKPLNSSLKDYGLNFGTAFQIIDDYLDLMSSSKDLGKDIGQDLEAGEITLPVLNLLETSSQDEQVKLKGLLADSKQDKAAIDIIKSRFSNSPAQAKTKDEVLTLMSIAKDRLADLPNSVYKDSLIYLADILSL